MPIQATDIQYRFSGGASNAVANSSLGGAKSSVAVTASLFDDVQAAEATSGLIEYRCFYVHNAHATLALTNAKAWIQANTPSADTTFDIGVGTSAVNATEQTVGAETTAPAGVTFSAPSTYAAGVVLGDIPAGQSRAVWIRRSVTAGAAAVADSGTIRVQGDTAP